MATKKKKVEEPKIETVQKVVEDVKKVEAPKPAPAPTPAPGPKFAVGNIVFIGRDADTDLEGFKLFPQYKKYAYTVEAYDGHTGVYTLRRLNLSLKLKEDQILAPSERAHDKLNRAQY